MTRVIKFRGMDLEGRWFYGLPCIIIVGRDRGSYISNSCGMPMAYDIRPETLTQFTGLVDKNGKEVFEGDVVRWGMNKVEDAIRYAVVEFNPDIQFRILFYFDEKINKKIPGDNYIFHYARFAYSKTEKHLEVIGNIYENGDLLK